MERVVQHRRNVHKGEVEAVEDAIACEVLDSRHSLRVTDTDRLPRLSDEHSLRPECLVGLRITTQRAEVGDHVVPQVVSDAIDDDARPAGPDRVVVALTMRSLRDERVDKRVK